MPARQQAFFMRFARFFMRAAAEARSRMILFSDMPTQAISLMSECYRRYYAFSVIDGI